MNPTHGDLVMFGVSIGASPNLNILDVKFDRKFTGDEYVGGIVSGVSRRIGIFRSVNRIFVDTSVLLRHYFAFVLQILEYYSPEWGSAVEYHLQLLER